MTIDINRLKRNIIFLLVAGMSIMLTQRIGAGKTPILETLPGMGILIFIAIIALVIKELFPKSFFPAFGWVTIIGFLISMPYNPLHNEINKYVGKINLLAITTPLLAAAGISVGNKIDDLKKMSWKIVLVSVVVFVTIFFACALIAEIVLRLTGEI